MGFKSTGNYDNTKQYEKLDVVYYNGNSYVAIKDSIGQLPTNTEYWDIIAKKGDIGETGNGITSIEKTSTSGLVDTYTITFTNGQTTTYEVTNGANGDVADVQVDGTSVVDNGIANIVGLANIKQEFDDMYNLLPKVSGTGELITLDGTAAGKMLVVLKGNTSQEETPTPEIPQDIHIVKGNNTLKTGSKNLLCLPNGTRTNGGITGVVSNNNVLTFSGKASRGWGDITSSSQSMTLEAGTYSFSIDKPISCRIVLYIFGGSCIIQPGNTSGTLSLAETKTGSCYVGFSQMTTGTSYSGTVKMQLEKGSPTVYGPYRSQSYPINLGDIELCKIVDYQDTIVKNNGKWYLNKQIGKIESYNGETITTSYISTTGGLDTGATVYYVLATPTYTEITDSTLISQLEAIRSYDTQTNITQTNEDLPFNLDVTALMSLQNIFNE